MAEENTNSGSAQVTEDKKSSSSSKTALKIALGIILVLLGLLAVIGWWVYLRMLFQGCIGLFLIMAGAITIAIAKE